MTNPLHVMLADDDADDRFFFEKAVKLCSVPAFLTTVDNGASLMNYLGTNTEKLPDVLFLDLNMPKKNGSECLRELKLSETLRDLPVVIYSTSLHADVADLLYRDGAYYYIKKTDLIELQKLINKVLSLIAGNRLVRREREQFILTSKQSALIN